MDWASNYLGLRSSRTTVQRLTLRGWLRMSQVRLLLEQVLASMKSEVHLLLNSRLLQYLLLLVVVWPDLLTHLQRLLLI